MQAHYAAAFFQIYAASFFELAGYTNYCSLAKAAATFAKAAATFSKAAATFSKEAATFSKAAAAFSKAAAAFSKAAAVFSKTVPNQQAGPRGVFSRLKPFPKLNFICVAFLHVLHGSGQEEVD